MVTCVGNGLLCWRKEWSVWCIDTDSLYNLGYICCMHLWIDVVVWNKISPCCIYYMILSIPVDCVYGGFDSSHSVVVCGCGPECLMWVGSGIPKSTTHFTGGSRMVCLRWTVSCIMASRPAVKTHWQHACKCMLVNSGCNISHLADLCSGFIDTCDACNKRKSLS